MSLLFKIAGLAVIFCVCAMGGFHKSRTIRKRAQRLSSVYRSMTVLAERIKTGAGEVGVILPLCFEEGLVYMEDGKICFDSCFLEKGDIDLLNEFFGDLGAEDKDSEYERTRLFAELINKQAREAEMNAENLCKLYNTLGISAGVFICIFFL